MEEFTKNVNGREVKFRIKDMDITFQLSLAEIYGQNFISKNKDVNETSKIKNTMFENIQFLDDKNEWCNFKEEGSDNYQLNGVTIKLAVELEKEFINRAINPVFIEDNAL